MSHPGAPLSQYCYENSSDLKDLPKGSQGPSGVHHFKSHALRLSGWKKGHIFYFLNENNSGLRKSIVLSSGTPSSSLGSGTENRQGPWSLLVAAYLFLSQAFLVRAEAGGSVGSSTTQSPARQWDLPQTLLAVAPAALSSQTLMPRVCHLKVHWLTSLSLYTSNSPSF